MLLFFFVLAVALGVGVFAAIQLRAETGYVLISYHSWVLETSLLGFIAAVVLLVLAVFYGFKLIRFGVALPSRWKSHHERRKADAAQLRVGIAHEQRRADVLRQDRAVARGVLRRFASST